MSSSFHKFLFCFFLISLTQQPFLRTDINQLSQKFKMVQELLDSQNQEEAQENKIDPLYHAGDFFCRGKRIGKIHTSQIDSLPGEYSHMERFRAIAIYKEQV